MTVIRTKVGNRRALTWTLTAGGVAVDLSSVTGITVDATIYGETTKKVDGATASGTAAGLVTWVPAAAEVDEAFEAELFTVVDFDGTQIGTFPAEGSDVLIVETA